MLQPIEHVHFPRSLRLPNRTALAGVLVHELVEVVDTEERKSEHAGHDGNDHEDDGGVPVFHKLSLPYTYDISRPPMITPAQDSRTTAATHLALIGASSPALTVQSRSDNEKYTTAIAPIVIRAIFGAKVVAFR